MMTLINALSNVIYARYPSKDIFIENVEQNFQPGSFFITVLASTDDGGMSYRRYRSYSYDVAYYPVSDTEPMAECLAVGEALREDFDLIEYDGRYLKTEDRSLRMVDDILHIEVTFKVAYDTAVVEPVMETIESEVTRE